LNALKHTLVRSTLEETRAAKGRKEVLKKRIPNSPLGGEPILSLKRSGSKGAGRTERTRRWYGWLSRKQEVTKGRRRTGATAKKVRPVDRLTRRTSSDPHLFWGHEEVSGGIGGHLGITTKKKAGRRTTVQSSVGEK